MIMQPLEFRPILKRLRWGGRRLGTLLGKRLGIADDYAESWEIASHTKGCNRIASGLYAGKTSQQLVQEWPQQMLGRHAEIGHFPLLVKFLDANDRLSVQVHPNDEQAKKYGAEKNGKTEAWVILAANPESCVYAGLKEGVTAEQLRQSIETGTIESCLHTFSVSPGDCLFIPAGTVHAIGEGILLAEIQQSSDLTFRLHDWGRLGTDGSPRELHIEEAIACIDFDRGPISPVRPVIESSEKQFDENSDTVCHEKLVDCEQFVIRRSTTQTPFWLKTDNRFHVLMLLSGAAILRYGDQRHWHPVTAGRTLLIPADCPDVQIIPVLNNEESPENSSDRLVLLDTYLP